MKAKRSVYDADAFEERVQFASQRILSGQQTTRHFDTCFEMSDGLVVIEAIRRRALKNPRLMAAIPKYLAPSGFIEAEAMYGHLQRSQLPRAAQEAREEWKRNNCTTPTS